MLYYIEISIRVSQRIGGSFRYNGKQYFTEEKIVIQLLVISSIYLLYKNIIK